MGKVAIVIAVVAVGVVGFLWWRQRRARAAADPGNQLTGSIAATSTPATLAQLDAPPVATGGGAGKNPFGMLSRLGRGAKTAGVSTSNTALEPAAPTVRPAALTTGGAIAALNARPPAPAPAAKKNTATKLTTVGKGTVATLKVADKLANNKLAMVAATAVPGGAVALGGYKTAKAISPVVKPLAKPALKVAAKVVTSKPVASAAKVGVKAIKKLF